MISINLRQLCSFTDALHHDVQFVYTNRLGLVPNFILIIPLLSWILEKKSRTQGLVSTGKTLALCSYRFGWLFRTFVPIFRYFGRRSVLQGDFSSLHHASHMNHTFRIRESGSLNAMTGEVFSLYKSSLPIAGLCVTFSLPSRFSWTS